MATFVGLLALCIKQRINIFDRVILLWGLGLTAFCGWGVLLFLLFAGREDFVLFGFFAANSILFTIIVIFIVAGFVKRINVYDAFYRGRERGF